MAPLHLRMASLRLGCQEEEHWRVSGGRSQEVQRPESLVKVPLMKIKNELRVEDVVSRNPGPLLRTITLPVAQILETSTPAAGVQQMQRRVDGTSVNDKGKGGGAAGTMGLSQNGFT